MTSGSHEQSPPGAFFRLFSADGGFSASGLRCVLPAGPIETLGLRAGGFFAGRDGGPDRLVGAIPFDRAGADCLYQPETIRAEGARDLRPAAVTSLARWRVTGEPSAERYGAAVTECLRRIAAEPALRKIVLSRSLVAQADRPIDADALLARLVSDRSVMAFRASLPPLGAGARALVGASPELLVSRKGRAVVSHPLAGSARRHADPSTDRAAAEGLERSDKDRREHGAVAEAVLDALAPYCDDLGAPAGTTLRATATMWHLGTRIAGRLRDADTPVAELLAALHPTPAVCGLPRERAAELIAAEEGYDRGFYAGAVGWMDCAGDGEWYVSLRCAEIEGTRLRLYAGAGIVEGSDPEAETAETSAKFVAMLSALGIDEDGRLLEGAAA